MPTAGNIQQVFANIILNAEEVMIESEQKGNLGIKTRLKNKDTIEIVVKDNGPGISKEILGESIRSVFHHKGAGEKNGFGSIRNLLYHVGARRSYP